MKCFLTLAKTVQPHENAKFRFYDFFRWYIVKLNAGLLTLEDLTS